MRVWGLALGIVAVGVAIVAVVIIFGGGEPDFDEAMGQLVRKPGVGSVQRVTISREPLPLDFDRYGLLALPKGYDGYSRGPMEQERREPLPLVLSLHGYGSHFMEQDSYFGLSELMESYDFALLLANGKRDDEGNRFWNATEFCCGVTEGKPDDAGYLEAQISGGSNPEIGEGSYPDAREVAGRWARRADCGLGVEVTPAGLMDIDADMDGFETRIFR